MDALTETETCRGGAVAVKPPMHASPLYNDGLQVATSTAQHLEPVPADD